MIRTLVTHAFTSVIALQGANTLTTARGPRELPDTVTCFLMTRMTSAAKQISAAPFTAGIVAGIAARRIPPQCTPLAKGITQ